MSTAPSHRLTAFEQLRAERKTHRLFQLVGGLIGYGTSLTFLVQSGLGPSSWNVLAEGVSLRTGLTFGWATNLIAVLVLVFWIPLRELPGLGTLLNVVLVGLAADGSARFISEPASLSQQIAYFAIGVLVLTSCDAIYLGARFGSGPRDGLMTGAVRISGRPIWVVRMSIDLVVLACGWALGGTVGFGTLLIAVLMGPLVQFFLRFTTVKLEVDTMETVADISACTLSRMSGLTCRRPTEQDHPAVLEALDAWWGNAGGANGGDERARLVPRLFLQHFTDTSVIVEDQGEIVAFLIGFLSQSRSDQAYIHFVGVAPTHRRRGIANDLYRNFYDTVRRHGRRSVHAITSVSNASSQDFHRRMGFVVSDPVVNYDGRGGDRVTFQLELS